MGKFDKFRNRAMHFMYGRYGIDEFYKFLSVIFLILVIVNFFAHSFIISIAEGLLIAYIYFRVLSRNFESRRKENYFYVKCTDGIRSWAGLTKNRFRDRKTHVYRKCPGCGKTLRLPKRKGKHSVCCPMCKHNFNVKI